jgi:hypothetical protein
LITVAVRHRSEHGFVEAAASVRIRATQRRTPDFH